MIEVETRTKIPYLWGKSVFKKSNWTQINLIVGPNGSGKTILAQNLARQFSKKGYSISFIKADRGKRTKELTLLKNDEKIRTKIEKVLSSIFAKSIKFIEDIDGSLIPIVENKAWNVEYMLEDVECHGLKEIISLLINLYKNNEQPGVGECIFFDEPELHLHPQFQTFFMNEIRKEVSHTSRKIFFLITHSPFFIDLRSSEDLTGVIVCHINRCPTTIEELSREDDALFKKFLPRFNTYHKQFFFSDNQIFVEGYTDQQTFTYLLPFLENEYHAAGTGIIDVGGKDELGVFCKVCSLLGTNGRIITDLDSLFSGKLRDVFCEDERVCQWLDKQKEKQEAFYQTIFSEKELLQPVSLSRLIRKLEFLLTELGKEILLINADQLIFPENSQKKQLKEEFNLFIQKLNLLQEKYENAEAIDTYKTVLLQGVSALQELLLLNLDSKKAGLLPVIKNLTALILAAAEAGRVYILPKGCIEHYYSQEKIKYMPVSAKDRLFRNELDFIQNSHKKTIRKKYGELIEILQKASL